MAIHRGAQSAVFYYLSCAPCTGARIRRKRKEEARYDRADRELLEAQMPNLYRHPSPSSTNPYWQSDIALGPVPMSRGGKRKKKQGMNYVENNRLKTSATQSSHGSGLPSSVDLPRTESLEKQSGQSWRQYQREDEALWGSSMVELPNGSSVKGGPTRPATARTTDSAKYSAYRNPAVNDMHPAIVTRAASRDDVAWMLQPPPVADVMSGKQRPTTAASSTSSLRDPYRTGSPYLSAQSSRRGKDKRVLASDGISASGVSRDESSRGHNDPTGQRHDRDQDRSAMSKTDDKDFADPAVRRSKRKPSPIKIYTEDSDESGLTVIRRSPSEPLAPRESRRKEATSRPPLPTIMSDHTVTSENEGEDYTPPISVRENSRPSSGADSAEYERDKNARRSAILVHDGSLKPLGDKTPQRTLFNTKIFAASPAYVDSKVRLPPQDDGDQRRLSGGPELFDSWYTPEFEIDKWIHEHTKREVAGRKRWSMDI